MFPNYSIFQKFINKFLGRNTFRSHCTKYVIIVSLCLFVSSRFFLYSKPDEEKEFSFDHLQDIEKWFVYYCCIFFYQRANPSCDIDNKRCSWKWYLGVHCWFIEKLKCIFTRCIGNIYITLINRKMKTIIVWKVFIIDSYILPI